MPWIYIVMCKWSPQSKSQIIQNEKSKKILILSPSSPTALHVEWTPQPALTKRPKPSRTLKAFRSPESPHQGMNCSVWVPASIQVGKKHGELLCNPHSTPPSTLTNQSHHSSSCCWGRKRWESIVPLSRALPMGWPKELPTVSCQLHRPLVWSTWEKSKDS